MEASKALGPVGMAFPDMSWAQQGGEEEDGDGEDGRLEEEWDWRARGRRTNNDQRATLSIEYFQCVELRVQCWGIVK